MCAVSTGAHSEAMAHTTSPKSVSSVALAVSTLLSALSLSAFGAPSAHAETFAHEKQQCVSNVCLVTVKYTVDSDGDGVSDEDEITAGTDPKDPLNRPKIKDLLADAAIGELPSFNGQFTEVLVMPTEGPDGQAFGIAGSFPERDGILGMFGVGKDLLNQAGLTANGGLRVGIDLNGFGGGGRQIGVGHTPVKVGGLDFGLISAGTKGDDHLFGMGENGGKSHSGRDVTTDMHNGNVVTQRNYDDGSSSMQVRNTKSGDITQYNYPTSGGMSPYGETKSSTSSSTGSSTTITTENAAGTRSTTETSGTAKDGTKFSMTSTSFTFPDGGGYETTDITETKNGTTTKTHQEDDTTCTDTTCTTETTSTTTTTKGNTTTETKSTTSSTRTKKTPGSTEPADEYSNPDADYSTIWVSDAQFARVLDKINDNKMSGPVQFGPSDFDPAVTIVSSNPRSGSLAGGFSPLVALVDDMAGSVGSVPTIIVMDYDHGPAPEKDPRLPNLLDGMSPGRCPSCNS
jgi:hypothetical protein